MLKFIIKIYAVICLLVILFPQNIFAQDRVKNVVIFFSNGSNIPGYEYVLEGLKSSISSGKDEPVNIVVEYLDIGRLENDLHASYIINLYRKKFKEIKIDLFIVFGPGINGLLLKYGKDLLSSAPVIDFDIDVPGRITLQDMNVKEGKEILINFRIAKMLQKAFDIFPDYKNVYIISGASGTDSYFTSLIRKCQNDFGPAYNFRYISGLSIDSTIQLVKEIPPSSVVVVPSFYLDGKNVPFSTPEVISIISDISAAPVFPMSDFFIKKAGGIGGYVFSYHNLGKETGRISREILHGKKLGDVALVENSFYQNIFDWQELKRWHLINSKAIPVDSIFYNKNTPFIILYKWYILGLFAFLVFQTGLILYLIRLNRRQKVITERMLVTETMHRELIRTDRLSKMSTLTASLSHELFQPLSAIRITALAGKRFIQTGKLNMDRASRMFENILDDDIRATGIINSVKGLMKMETPDKENVNLNSLIQETVDIIRSEAIKSKIKINLKFDNDPVIVFGDKIQLQQVLMNFIRNAMTAMEKNDPENRILDIILKLDKESVIVSVRDSGPGLDPAIKEKLFKPFITTRKEGFGIGLTLCKTLIEKHNGKIWAENIPEGGTLFSFSLNVTKSE